MASLPSDITIKAETRPVTVFKDSAKEEVNYTGKFHKFGVDYWETENGVGNFTVAIIEKPNGSVIAIHPSYIRFDDVNGDHYDK